MKKPYFTRKNLIILSLSFLFSFLLLFVGMCIEGSHSFVKGKNPINGLAGLLNFRSIECGVTGYLCLVLVAIYITVFVASILYERRYAIINQKNPLSGRMFVSYILSFFACCALSLGVGVLIQGINNPQNIKYVLEYVGECLAITLILYVAIVAFLGGILMFVVNYILIDKPFRTGDINELPDFDDEDADDQDVTSSFDTTDASVNGNLNGIAGGAVSGIGGGVGTGEEGNIRKAEQLDVSEKVFPGLAAIDVKYEGFSIEKAETDDIKLDELCVRFRNWLAKEEKLYYELDVIRFFISGLATSHFMILEGLSGTGKSSLPRYFAKFVNANVIFVPVQATWRDKTNLIGYFNDFAKTYSETEFLLALYNANYNPDMINLFVLDEMNISRVEYYFADFLSVLEFPKSEWKLKLMQLPYEFIPPVKLEGGNIQIPENSYFIGTANKDDSTFTITDKVYDRAITIDFDDKNIPFSVPEEVSSIHLSHSKLMSLYKEASENMNNHMTDGDFAKFNAITKYIYDEFDITFGNRILNQITTLVPVFVACGGTKEDALDFLLSRKVISKIEGRFEDYVKDALKGLLDLINKTYGTNVLKRSEKTIQMLMRRL